MKVIKFVQWQSAILIGVVVLSGLASFFFKGLYVQDWVAFATIAILFILPQTGAAFFGPVLKRKQEVKKENEGEN